MAGCPAIAVALDLRARVEAVPLAEKEVIEIESRELGHQLFERNAAPGHPLYPVYVAARAVLARANENIGLFLRIESDIPPSAGMGSSAAVAVATVAAVARLVGLRLDPEEISRTAYEAEVQVHGKPSGIDNTVSAYGGAVYYKKDKGFYKLEADFNPIKLILADSGITRSTGELVSRVLKFKSKYPSVLDPIYAAASNLVESARTAIERGDYVMLGELMNVNHGLLSAIGVSNAKLEELVYAARHAGALGAKITGAGGGGMILALAWKEDAEKIAQALTKISKRVIVANISHEGARIEKSGA